MAKRLRVAEVTIDDVWTTADRSTAMILARIPELRHPVRVRWYSGRPSLCSTKGEPIDPALGNKLAADVMTVWNAGGPSPR
jgi:hypothetical protein